MKLLDRIIKVSSEQAAANPLSYDVYDAGAKGSLVGLAAITGGLVLNAVGVEASESVMVAGIIVMDLGGTAMVSGLSGMSQNT
jgi:hypothetical protein